MAILVAYFSRADENYVSGALKMLKTGNTKCVAEIIGKQTEADLFEISMTHPYAKGYNQCIDEAHADQRSNARPELTGYPDSIDVYDTIYLGYPNYWGTMPMAVFTFLEHFDLTGKKIRPFCTHEGSGLGSSVNDIKRLCPKANVTEGIAIHGSRIGNSDTIASINKWIKAE